MANPLKNDKSTSLGLLLARLPIGVLFTLQGWNKVKNIGVTRFVADHITMVPSYMPPWFPKLYLTAVPIAELTFGLFVVFGLLTRVAGFLRLGDVGQLCDRDPRVQRPAMDRAPQLHLLGRNAHVVLCRARQNQLGPLAVRWQTGFENQMGLTPAPRSTRPANTKTPAATLSWVFLLLAAPLLCCGCGGRITPPPNPLHPVTVYVTDYGRHSTLLLGDAHGKLVEYTWGDWDWLGLNDRKWYLAVTALFSSRASAFGRKWIDADPAQLSAKSIGGVGVLSLSVDQERAEHLRHSLDDRFMADANTTVYNPTDQCCYARDSKSYGLFYNCNDQTAEWLRALGCRVDGMTTTSKFTLAK